MANYIVNAYNNGGSGGSVNMRTGAGTNYGLVVRVPHGATVTGTKSGTWSYMTYGSYSGYMMSVFLDDAGTSTPDTGDIKVGDTVKTILPGVNFRSTPGGTSLFQVTTGTTMVVTAVTTSGGYTWYKGVLSGKTGYLRGDCVEKYSSGGSGGTSTYTFVPSNAVTYALNHSDNSSSGVACTKRNTYFPTIDGNDDCADFVSQCLCAGGVPMFNGWFYRLTGIPASWSDSKWGVTYSGYQRLNGKGWLQAVAYNAIQAGDIIYSYNPTATPTPYTHVTIAVSGNVTENGKYGCRICGCTTNQHDKFKELTATNCKCYRVMSTLTGDGSEKRVSLPSNGNGATVL